MFKHLTPPINKLGILGKFGQSNMLGLPTLHAVYAKSQPKPFMDGFNVTRNNMANGPGCWCAGEKEWSSSVIVRAKLLKTQNLFIWNRNPAEERNCISKVNCYVRKHLTEKYGTSGQNPSSDF